MGGTLTAAATLGPWLDAVLARSRALLLEGPAGIGKTYLLNQLVDATASVGGRVLRAQPAQSEVRLIGSALIDLCDEVTDDEIAQLPEMQSASLSAALLRADDKAPANPQAVAVAFTRLLKRLAEEQPLFVCIDDIQWLDAQTADVLAFAARRLPPTGVGLLLTLRTEPGKAAPDLIADLGAALQVSRWTVPPMVPSDLEALLRNHLGGVVPSGVLRAAVTSSGGNPLFGIEVARAMLQRDRETSHDAVPMPDSLAELVGRHVTALPEPTRVCLAAASALRRPNLRQLRDLGVADSLDAAERAGLVRIDGHDVMFTHPLYAAAAYDGLAAGERMRLHTRLADVVNGEEERARHLALGADEPDEDVAAALDVARDRALARGALDAALDACQLGLRATPSSSAALSVRRIQLGNLLFRSGETDRARHELTSTAESATGPLDRARALHALARVVNDTEGPAHATPLELQALVLAGEADLDLTADIHMGLAVSNADDWAVALAHARTAVALLEQGPSPNPRRLGEALTAQLGPTFYAGEGADFESCRRAIELQGNDLSVPVSDRAVSVLFYLQMWVDEFPAARQQMDYVYRLCVEESDEASRCYVLACRSQLEVRSGRWDEAERLIQECIDLAQTSQNAFYVRGAATQRAWLAAYRGDLASAVLAADEEIERGVSTGIGVIEQRGRALRGFCALVQDDAHAAAEDLDRYQELFATNNAAEPTLRQLAGDHIEALVAAGRMADAERALQAMVEPATRLNRVGMLAAAARAEALVRAEQGDADSALAAAERSLELYDRIERRLDRARAMLTKGQVHRRFKQKSLARRELTAALAAFEALGAAGFAEKTRAELGRVGLRPPAAQDLTETERQIAALTATGQTSAEIGRALFLSTKTVSANLTRIYRKLGVRNRAELAAALTGPGPGGDSDMSVTSAH
ncbi:MAG: hypothetical protein QOH52_1263 [Pseudonocardiales bacterium]|nr:hypothetical protein [Pseudonocardiales bacterium]